jgi:hypothetical protein
VLQAPRAVLCVLTMNWDRCRVSGAVRPTFGGCLYAAAGRVWGPVHMYSSQQTLLSSESLLYVCLGNVSERLGVSQHNTAHVVGTSMYTAAHHAWLLCLWSPRVCLLGVTLCRGAAGPGIQEALRRACAGCCTATCCNSAIKWDQQLQYVGHRARLHDVQAWAALLVLYSC